MIEKVNPCHPDKVADRIAGAIVDLAYRTENDPKIAVEVLIGHGACYVIIERPTYQELSQFNHTKGKMCNLSKTIGSLKGFTICDANIDLKGIAATEQEKQEISNILSSGFFA